MGRKKQKKDIPVPPAPALDASALIYRDRSGPKLSWGLTEGKDNFGAVTAEAKKTVELAK